MSKRRIKDHSEENSKLEDISKSPDIKQEKINKLKEIMPEVFNEGDKIDVDKLKKILGDFVNEENERYVLNWAGKSESFKILQTQTTATLAPDKEESINFDTTENIFIEGENLEVLKVLQKSYHNKIKMIYIDPPYNTGNDSFIYPDKFDESKSDYLKRIGEKDEEGFLLKEGLFRKNSKENGQYHSNWLSMIYPRLFLARNLLKDDGVIFVSIDDNEVHNLRMVLNEIFGEENFISMFAWRRTDNQPNIGNVAKVKEYILCFSKNDSKYSFNKMILTDRAKKEYRYKDSKGFYRRAILLDKTRGRYTYDVITPSRNVLKGPWMIKEEEFINLNKGGLVHWAKKGDELPHGKIYLDESEGQITNDFLGIEFGTNQQGSLEVEELFGKRYFDFPKPFSLIKHFVTIGSSEDDIILDFFAGSGTTAQAVLNLNKEEEVNRKFILVQLPEKTDEDSEAYKANYKSISDICKERIRRVIKSLESETNNAQIEIGKEAERKLDLGFKVFKLKNSNFKLWRGDEINSGEELTKQLDVFQDPIKTGADDENIVYELILKMGLDMNVKVESCFIDTDESKKKKKGLPNSEKYNFFRVDDGKLFIFTYAKGKIGNLLNHILKTEKPEKIICLDKIFDGDDEAKTNLVLQMRDAGVEFKTV